MACDVLQAFATATENLDQDIIRIPSHADVFTGAIPKGSFDKNRGVNKTLFTMQHSEPPTDQPAFDNITLDGNGQPTPACTDSFTDVALSYYTRNYGPKQSKLRGPEICREQLEFQHNIGEFLGGYVNELGRYSKRFYEFLLREDYLSFATAAVDPAAGGPGFHPGPNAFDTMPTPQSDLTQDTLDLVADYLIDVGATEPDSNGYIMNGGEGPLFTLLVNRVRSSNIVVNNADRRQDARYAIPNELWKRVNATRILGNFRHVPIGNAPRANLVEGNMTRVNTYRAVTAITGQQLTNDYLSAQYEAAIVLLPTVFQADIVAPFNWQFNDTLNYMGDWSFVQGGWRIDAACADPLGNRGRHYAEFKYAAKPILPYTGVVIWYKRCANTTSYAYCS